MTEPTRILVAGDANVDLILGGDVVPRFGQAEQLLDRADLVIGGSASIVAGGLARLGMPVALAAELGDDEFGRYLSNALAAAGVDIGGVGVRVDAPTGISVILSSTEDRSILTMPGTVPLLTADRVRRAVDDTGAGHVHVASLFLQPALMTQLPSLLQWLRARSITTSIDTNWDPSESWGGLDEIIPRVDYVMPNREELRRIAAALGLDASSDESSARGLADLGPTIVVKAGGEGGWSCDRSGTMHSAPGLAVEVVDTTGAGDSFDAGYLAAMSSGIDDEGMRLRWATTAGSLSTLASGGTAAQPTLPELLAGLHA